LYIYLSGGEEEAEEEKERVHKAFEPCKSQIDNRHNGRGDNDDDNNNEGVARKTLVTATIWRESDAANADILGGAIGHGIIAGNIACVKILHFCRCRYLEVPTTARPLYHKRSIRGLNPGSLLVLL
jgi:hypothetical protein